jgi:ceramide glucosyltransferase
MSAFPTIIAMGAALLAVAGIGYLLVAARLAARLADRCLATPPSVNPVAITLLKPLHGGEPNLAGNLATFIDQGWPADVQLVAGVADAGDPAIAAISALQSQHPDAVIDLVVDPTRHGSNAKIGNIVNLMTAARHELLVLSDSDIAAPPGYFTRIVAALAAPGVGAVTCLYRGRGDAGFWSVLAAANISYQFLPSVLVSLSLDAGGACMGSTIALRRETLDRIGGFRRFANILADDHAVGEAVRTLGLSVQVPAMIVTHGCAEASFAALVRQELRWGATVRDLRPMGYLGSVITMPLPFALLALALLPGTGTATLMIAAIAARLLLATQIDRAASAKSAPYALLPLRELLSFGIFAASFLVRDIDWRGQKLRMLDAGLIANEQETGA